MNVVALIGSPVAHSLSPAIHNAAFEAAGLDWRFVSFEVPAGQADAALDAVRVLGITGLAVTTPHKQQVAMCVDELDESAAEVRSVNTVVAGADGGLHGSTTDGDGFVAGLAAEGVDIAGRRVAVLGAGAAARSVIASLGRRQASEIVVVNRTADRAAEASALAGVGRVGRLDDVHDADVVVNATSVGMGGDESPLPAELLHSGQAVADLVYHPLDTALLRRARAAGCRTVDGVTTLVHQAVLQQRRWTGRAPDVAVMRRAADTAAGR